MDRSGALDDVLARVGAGEDPAAIRAHCLDACADDPAWTNGLAGFAAFLDGDFVRVSDDAAAARAAATDPQAVLLAAGVQLLAYAGDATAYVEPDPAPALVAELRAALSGLPSGGDPVTSWLRYLGVEAALTAARLDDAAALLATGPPPHRDWAGHAYAAMMVAVGVRVAAFTGRVSDAVALLPELRAAATTPRAARISEAVEHFVLGNADLLSARNSDLPEVLVDHVDRGVCLLHAYGAIAVGDVPAAAALVLRAGAEPDLARLSLVDRGLGLELLVVAALAEDDLDAALAWDAQADPIAGHPVPRPTVDRLRSRIALATGDAPQAVLLGERAVAGCRDGGRSIEVAESEIVLARAHLAAGDVSGASQLLRPLVAASDASGHAAVRRSAGRTLGTAGRRLPPVAHGRWDVLTAREREVARLVLAGNDLGQIARALRLSTHTVRGHVSRVLTAFGVATRTGLLAAVGPLPGAAAVDLTPRQAEVCDLVARGRSNPQIAEALGISVKGVEKHVSDIARRWGVASRFEIAVRRRG
ncbi:MAG: hypothetical protein JWO46_406 [Nocardioidaceae bacterium]|nr:hypothetical protein [Nocardioidaceae bacterium]